MDRSDIKAIMCATLLTVLIVGVVSFIVIVTPEKAMIDDVYVEVIPFSGGMASVCIQTENSKSCTFSQIEPNGAIKAKLILVKY